jgi:hypothetical protein
MQGRAATTRYINDWLVLGTQHIHVSADYFSGDFQPISEHAHFDLDIKRATDSVLMGLNRNN